MTKALDITHRDLLIKLNTNMETVLGRMEYHGKVLDVMVPQVASHATSIKFLKWGLGLAAPVTVAGIAIVNFILSH